MKKNYYLIVPLILFSLFSCGGDDFLSPSKKKTKKPTSIQLIENGCASDDTSSKATLSTRELIERFDAHTKVLAETQSIFVDSVSSQRDEFKSTPFRPHFMSEERIESRKKSLEQKFNDYITKENKNKSQWLELSRDLKRLQGLALRWEAQRCSLSQMKRDQTKDVRVYVSVLEKKDLFKCSSDKSCDEEFVADLFRNDLETLLSLCTYYKNRAFCINEINRHKGRPLRFYQAYMNKHKERYDRFFNLGQRRSLTCDKGSAEKVLKIKISNLDTVVSKSFVSKQALLKKVNDVWGLPGRLRVELVDQGPYNVITDFRNSHLSFVNHEEVATMVLSNSLVGNQFINVFIHEIGHVLGFLDCYIEFFDTDRKELVYYSLDRAGQNLMCEISNDGVIPVSYKELLLANYCF